MQNLRNSANKGSDDAYDVHTSLTSQDSEFADWVALFCDARVQRIVFDRIGGVGYLALRRESRGLSRRSRR